MASCCLAKIQSRVKGYSVYNYAFEVGEILNCSIENDKEYSKSSIAYFQAVRKWMVIFRSHLLKLFSNNEMLENIRN